MFKTEFIKGQIIRKIIINTKTNSVLLKNEKALWEFQQ